jgi:hypothetical protein
VAAMEEKRYKNLEDEYKWSRETAQALRSGNLAIVDIDALINELESTAGSLEIELSRHIEKVLVAKLRLRFTDSDPRENRMALVDALDLMDSLIWACPSLRNLVTGQFIEKAYCWAKQLVADDFNVTLPDACPFSCDSILRQVETLDVEQDERV